MGLGQTFSSYDFVRDSLQLSADLVGAGYLRLSVPRALQRRKLYVGVIWAGVQDWTADGLLEVVDKGAPVEVFRQRWGTSYTYGASSTGWNGTNNSWRRTTGGFPGFEVVTYDPTLAPNMGANSATCEEAIIISSVYQTLTSKVGYRCTMVPLELFGPVEEVRFRFTAATITTADTNPAVEVYLGMKSLA